MIERGQRVEVFWNLHKHLFSVRALAGAEKGRVLLHAHTVCIKKPQFVVQPGGRARVLREKRKNVHAFVRGTLVGVDEVALGYTPEDNWNRITYNPYRDTTFVWEDRSNKLHPLNFAEIITARAIEMADGTMKPLLMAWGLGFDSSRLRGAA